MWRFRGRAGFVRYISVLLLTHTILAVVIVPMILVTLRRAWLERFDRMDYCTVDAAAWFYGECKPAVIVYLMLYQVYTAQNR